MVDKYVLTSVFEMSSPRGQEVSRGFSHIAMNFRQFLDMPDDDKDKIFFHCIAVMKKVGKLAHAVDRYEELEKKEIKKLTERAKNDKSSVTLTHASSPIELEGAIEDVLSQAKSSLDTAIKILEPLFGIRLVTFGDNGKKVLKALDRNIPAQMQEKVEKLKLTIQEAESWLEILRKERTWTQHYGNIQASPLRVTAGEKGERYFELSNMTSGQSAYEFINVCYHNLFCFLQDFLVLSLEARLFGGLVVVIENGKEGRERTFAVGISKESLQEQKP